MFGFGFLSSFSPKSLIGLGTQKGFLEKSWPHVVVLSFPDLVSYKILFIVISELLIDYLLNLSTFVLNWVSTLG